MEYVSFGKTGRRVSRIGFGGAAAGLKNYIREYDPSDELSLKNVVAAIHKALELGITYFDTAPAYGKRKSELMFGEGLKGVKPESIFVATKVSIRKRDEVYKSVEQSLICLKRSYVDLIQIHGSSFTKEEVDSVLAPGGMLETLEELKRKGLAKFIGFSSEDNNEGTYRLMQTGHFDAVQLCYNFIFQHGFEPSRPFGSLIEAEKRKLGISAMRTPTSGTFQRWIQMVNPDNDFDYTPALIQFVLSNPLVDVALIGMRSKERVIQNVNIVNDTKGRIKLEELHNRYVK